MPPEPARLALSGLRVAIDAVDDALLLLVASRRHCVRAAGDLKRAAGLPLRDPQREADVRARAERLGRRIGLGADTGDRIVAGLINAACIEQGIAATPDLDQRAPHEDKHMLPVAMEPLKTPRTQPWLRLLPPPRRWAPVLRVLPSRWQARVIEAAVMRVLAEPLRKGVLEPLQDRRIGIDVEDLGLRWVLRVEGERLRVCPVEDVAEATVCGSATDLLLLASRREDADTLFFQRRLRLTGDTELGLLARNLLDQLPWESVPLGLRILLHRGAGMAQSARAAYHRTPA